jgi:uncharacterized RDD family membrane protein YckC
MQRLDRDHSLGDGVFFPREDCRGIRARIVILIVDMIVLVGLCIALGFLYPVVDSASEITCTLLCLVTVWVYLAVLRQSAIRTPGFWLTKSQIVTLKGERPSILRMTYRLLLCLVSPFNVVFDLAWSGIDIDRQSLRDRFAGTLLIRHRAKPIGSGEVHTDLYFLSGFTILFPRLMYRNEYTTKQEA